MDSVGNIRERIDEEYEDVLFCDGYDDCILGVVSRFGKEPIVCYDRIKMLEKMVNDDGMTWDDASEHFENNIIGGWHGDKTPCFIDLFLPAPDGCLVPAWELKEGV